MDMYVQFHGWLMEKRLIHDDDDVNFEEWEEFQARPDSKAIKQ